MKLTILILAIIVAAEVWDRGYPLVATFLLIAAFWEAVIENLGPSEEAPRVDSSTVRSLVERLSRETYGS